MRHLRLEAQGIPQILRVPIQNDNRRDDQVDGPDDLQHTGYYEDGAYFSAAPVDGAKDDVDYNDYDEGAESSLISAQDAYHAMLISRFNAQRALLRTTPTPAAIAALDLNTHPTHYHKNKAEQRTWLHHFAKTPPTPVQLAAITPETALALLPLATWLLKHNKLIEGGSQATCIGLWIWTLLSRVGEVGTLSSEEVWVIRATGKRAATVLAAWDRVETEMMADEGHEEDDDEDRDMQTEKSSDIEEVVVKGPDDRKQVDDEADDCAITVNTDNATEVPSEDSTILEAIRARVLAQHAPPDTLTDHADITPPPVPNTSAHASASSAADLEPAHDDQDKGDATSHVAFATLDAILTIVGECFGQRDLLASRDRLWRDNRAGGIA